MPGAAMRDCTAPRLAAPNLAIPHCAAPRCATRFGRAAPRFATRFGRAAPRFAVTAVSAMTAVMPRVLASASASTSVVIGPRGGRGPERSSAEAHGNDSRA
jgi:hypothetical protein